MKRQEIELLSQEIEMLMNERTHLLKVVGTAAALVATSDVKNLPDGWAQRAEALSRALNALPEETLKDALDSVHVEQDAR